MTKLELEKIGENDYEGRIYYDDNFNTELEQERVLERFCELKKDLMSGQVMSTLSGSSASTTRPEYRM